MTQRRDALMIRINLSAIRCHRLPRIENSDVKGPTGNCDRVPFCAPIEEKHARCENERSMCGAIVTVANAMMKNSFHRVRRMVDRYARVAKNTRDDGPTGWKNYRRWEE